MSDKDKNLIDYIISNIHACPFEDECGIDFIKECTGIYEESCRECIFRNADKLNC